MQTHLALQFSKINVFFEVVLGSLRPAELVAELEREVPLNSNISNAWMCLSWLSFRK